MKNKSDNPASEETLKNIKFRIKKRYGTYKAGAEALGKNYYTLLAKLHGKTHMKNSEAYEILKTIGEEAKWQH